MPATHVYHNHRLFEQYNKKNLASNYNALLGTVTADKLAIEIDQLRLTEDKLLHPRLSLNNQGQPFWDTLPTKPLLINKIKSGRSRTWSQSKYGSSTMNSRGSIVQLSNST
jgi:hypothetical protein